MMTLNLLFDAREGQTLHVDMRFGLASTVLAARYFKRIQIRVLAAWQFASTTDPSWKSISS